VDRARFPAVTARHFWRTRFGCATQKNVKVLSLILAKTGFDRFATGQFYILIIFKVPFRIENR